MPQEQALLQQRTHRIRGGGLGRRDAQRRRRINCETLKSLVTHRRFQALSRLGITQTLPRGLDATTEYSTPYLTGSA